MYYINQKDLMSQFKEDKFKSADTFKYFIANIFSIALFNTATQFLTSGKPNRISVFEMSLLEFLSIGFGIGLGLLILFLILKSYYKANGGEDGRHFLEKLNAFGFQFMNRTWMGVFPMLVGYGAMAHRLKSTYVQEERLALSSTFMWTTLVYFVFLLSVSIYFYLQMKKILKELRAHELGLTEHN